MKYPFLRCMQIYRQETSKTLLKILQYVNNHQNKEKYMLKMYKDTVLFVKGCEIFMIRQPTAYSWFIYSIPNVLVEITDFTV